jgi:uncharacterized membrane protein YfcA
MTIETLWLHLALAAAGLGAGFVNTLAGGGSMLTLPALMLLGLPADVANGTNRVSVLSHSVSGVYGFHRRGKLDTRALVPVLIPTVAGAAVGAVAASQVPPSILKYVLLGTMMTMAVLMAGFPARVTAPDGEEPILTSRRLARSAGLFATGLYGGFIQAGVGMLLLAVLGGVMRYDLVRGNALKLACTMVFGAVALAIFAAAGQVNWFLGALLAVYTTAGSQLGVRFAMRVNQTALRRLLLAAVVASCIAALLKA